MRSLTSVLSICVIFGVTGAFAAKGGKGGGGSSTAGPVTYQVNCNLGEKISDVLAPNNDQPITVEFSGTCNEDIGISIPRVTLRGIGSLAAIRGENRTSSGWDGYTIFVYGVHGVVLENFSILSPSLPNADERGLLVSAGGHVRLQSMKIQDCTSHGIGGYGAVIDIYDTTIERCENGMDLDGTTKVYGEGNNFINNRRDGIAASGGASVSMKDTVFEGNVRNGFQLWNGASGNLRRVTVLNNGLHGLAASQSSSIGIEESSVVSGNAEHGINVTSSSSAWIKDNVLFEQNGNRGVNGARGASIEFIDSVSRENASHGLNVDKAYASVVRSTLSQNGRSGINSDTSSVEMTNSTVSNNMEVGLGIQKGSNVLIRESTVENNVNRQVSMGEKSSLNLRSSRIAGNAPLNVWFDSAMRSNGGNTIEATGSGAVYIGESSSAVFDGNLGQDTLLGSSSGNWQAGIQISHSSTAQIREVVIKNFVGPALRVDNDSTVGIAQGRFESSGNMGGADVEVGADAMLKLLDAASSMLLDYGIRCYDDGRVKNYAALTPFIIEEGCGPQP